MVNISLKRPRKSKGHTAEKEGKSIIDEFSQCPWVDAAIHCPRRILMAVGPAKRFQNGNSWNHEKFKLQHSQTMIFQTTNAPVMTRV
jgi:hypothetical protein